MPFFCFSGTMNTITYKLWATSPWTGRSIRRTAPCGVSKSQISGKKRMCRLRNSAIPNSHIHSGFCLIIFSVFGDEHFFPMPVGQTALRNCGIK